MSDDIDSIMASARPNVPEPTALAPRSEVPAKSLIRMTDAGLEDREVILGLRPEQIMLAPAQTNGQTSAQYDGLPTIRAEVQVTEPTGPDTLVFVNLNQSKVCCRLAPDVAPQVGESLTLQFDPAKVLLFDAATGERLGVLATNQPSHERGGNITQINRN